MNQNDKFTLVGPLISMCNHANFGPIFGRCGPCDLQIRSGNQDPQTFADIGQYYTNSNYKYGDLESQ